MLYFGKMYNVLPMQGIAFDQNRNKKSVTVWTQLRQLDLTICLPYCFPLVFAPSLGAPCLISWQMLCLCASWDLIAVSNQRPTSLTVVCKIFQHVRFSSIIHHVNTYCLLCLLKLGFSQWPQWLSCSFQPTELTYELELIVAAPWSQFSFLNFNQK